VVYRCLKSAGTFFRVARAASSSASDGSLLVLGLYTDGASGAVASAVCCIRYMVFDSTYSRHQLQSLHRSRWYHRATPLCVSAGLGLPPRQPRFGRDSLD